MKVSSDSLKELYQRHTARRHRTAVDCPDGDTFRRAAEGTLSGDERARFADHLSACSDCADEYRVVRSVGDWVREENERAGGEPTGPTSPIAIGANGEADLDPARPPRRVSRRRLAAAAIVLIVAGGALVLSQIRPVPPSSERGPTLLGVRVTAIEPADLEELRDPPARLRWSTVASAIGYRVVVYDFESTLIWESEQVVDPTVAVPVAVRERLPREQPIYWRVVIVTDIDERRSSSFRFTVSR